MAKIFIPSVAYDAHAILLQISLEKRGNKVVRWIGDNFPESQTSSFYINGRGSVSASFEDSKSTFLMADFDVVWQRRPRWPVLPEYVDENDRVIADQECRHYIRSLWEASCENAVWVNSLTGRRKANSKLLQLKEACHINFNVPETLVSNDPLKIKNFINHNEGAVIVKPLLGGHFKDGKKDTYTSEISLDRLPEEKYIQACPAIYQRKILKEYEVRVIIFGATAIAVRIDSQLRADSSLDWRIINPSKLRMTVIKIPDQIYTQCQNLMNSLQIVHGSFDFAVDRLGNWVFFEVNEAGQFLWIEDVLPEVPLLEIATQFLSAPSKDFLWKKNTDSFRILDIETSSHFRELYEMESQHKTFELATAII